MVSDVSADTGYHSEEAVQKIESENGPAVYVAVEKGSHHKTVKNLEKQPDPPEAGNLC